MDADQLNTLERAFELATKARADFGDDSEDDALVEAALHLLMVRRDRWNRRAIEAGAANVLILALGALGITGWDVVRSKLGARSLEAENARLRAEVDRLSGNGPLVDPRLP